MSEPFLSFQDAFKQKTPLQRTLAENARSLGSREHIILRALVDTPTAPSAEIVANLNRLFRKRAPDVVTAAADHKQTTTTVSVTVKAASLPKSVPRNSEPVEPKPATMPQTPSGGEWLLAWFMEKASRDDVLGDLEEEYLTDRLPALGRRSATVWYWGGIAKSVWPFLRAWLRRAFTLALLIRVVRKLGL